jgi:hypothetical protein
MSRPNLRYEAGSLAQLRYAVGLPYYVIGMAPHRADMLTRYVEFWCQKNCRGDWRVAETDIDLVVSFADARDRVMFQISEEFLHFEENYVDLPQHAIPS